MDKQQMMQRLEEIAAEIDEMTGVVHTGAAFAANWEAVTPDDGGEPYQRGDESVTHILARLHWGASDCREAVDAIKQSS